MENKRVDYLTTFKFAGSVVAFIIGSGFATGQEILQFFTVYGKLGILGGLVTMFLFSACSAILMNYGFSSRDRKDENVFYHYCGKAFGTFMEWFTPIFCFLILVIMIAGAGATLNQYFGIPHLTGRVIMTVITMFAAFFGLTKLIDIIGYLGPFTILITLLIGLMSFDPAGLATVNQAIAAAENIPYGAGNSTSFWFIAAVLYAAYNLTCAVPFMSEMGGTANVRKEAVLGGLLGGVTLMLSGLIMSVAMMCHFSEVVSLEIPVLYLAQEVSPVLGSLFTAVLLGEIFSTSAPMLWTVANKFGGPDGTTKNKIAIVVATVVAFLASSFPFGKLVGTIYPFTGYIGTALIICILVRHVFDTKKDKSCVRHSKKVSSETI